MSKELSDEVLKVLREIRAYTKPRKRIGYIKKRKVLKDDGLQSKGKA